ncbi:MAG: ABC transporter permease subunit [Clostridia bacterium]|nr:ABC transporter permease subunit [Clostridia bacterium]
MKLKTGTSPTRSGFMTDLKWALKNWPLYAMFIPGFILTFLFAYLPMFGIVIAFKKINLRDGIFGSPWVGLSNFRALFRNDSVWEAIRNTLSYNIVFILTGLLFAVALAITLNLIRNKIASKIYQTVYIMPHFLSMVIIAYLVFAFLNMESGFINNSIIPMIMGENAQKVNWYAKAEAWPIILFIVKTWQSVGYSSIVYLAAIAGIDTELYEAAEIDGAGTWKQIIYITIPSLKTMMIIMTILNIGKIFSADFGLFYTVTMNSGALYPTTLVTNTYVYNLMTGAGAASMGMSAAASMLQSVVGFIMVVTTNMIVRKIDEESSLF